MAMTHLGETIDIHAGGSDLIFPHHENEIAQSEGATEVPFARVWLHGGMVNVTGDGETTEKMSKSLGNFWTIRDVLQVYHAEVVRTFFLTTHYRQPITYSLQMMEEAFGRLEYLYTTLHRINEALSRVEAIPESGSFVAPAAAPLSTFFDAFHRAMCDDFNFPAALVPIGELAKASNELTKSPKKPKPDVAYTLAAVRSALVQAGQVLGIMQRFPAEVLRELRDMRAAAMEIDSNEVQARIQARIEARNAKDWALADEIRAELTAMGIELMDGPEDTDWRIGKLG
jgi:cysteinyl-tRNA synthetase